MGLDDASVTDDRLFLALVTDDAFSIVPELFRILGREKFLQFVEVFGGTTIRIPNKQTLLESLRDIDIYRKHTCENVDLKTISDEYEIPYHLVRRIILRVQKAKNFGGQEGGAA